MRPSYHFARIFVRLSRLIAVALAILGGVYSIYRLINQVREASSIVYRSNPDFDFVLERLERDAAQVSSVVNKFLSQTGDGVAVSAPPAFVRNASKLDQFETLITQLKNYGITVDGLKEAMISGFEKQLDQLREQLISHAEAVAGPKMTVQGKGAPPATRAAKVEPDHIFIDMGNDLREKRVAALSEVWSYLQRLEQESEKEDNKVRLKDANSRLLWLIDLLPKPIEIEKRPQVTVTKLRNDVKAEQVAEALKHASMIVRLNILDSWKVDSSLGGAIKMAVAEKNRCETDSVRAGTLFLTAFEDGAFRFIASIVASFLVLVAADFLQTQLDIARNSARLVGDEVL